MFGLDIGKEKTIEGIENNLEKLVGELGGKIVKGKDRLIQELIELRKFYREKKEFEKADLIRKRLKEIGIVLEDEDGKTSWKVA